MIPTPSGACPPPAPPPRENARVRITFCGHVGFFVETRGGSVLCDPWFTPGVLRVVVPVPAQRQARRRARSRRPTTSTSRICTATTSIPSGSRAHVDKRATRAAPASSACPFLERELRALGFERLRADAARRAGRSRRRADGHDPRVHRAGRRAARRLAHRARRRHRARAQPERRAARRSRRAARARAVRRADGAVLGRDLVPDRLRLPRRAEGAARAPTSASTRWRGRSSTSSGSTPRTSSRARGRPRSSTTTCSRATTSTAIPRTSSPTRRCSSSGCATPGSTPAS